MKLQEKVVYNAGQKQRPKAELMVTLAKCNIVVSLFRFNIFQVLSIPLFQQFLRFKALDIKITRYSTIKDFNIFKY